MHSRTCVKEGPPSWRRRLITGRWRYGLSIVPRGSCPILRADTPWTNDPGRPSGRGVLGPERECSGWQPYVRPRSTHTPLHEAWRTTIRHAQPPAPQDKRPLLHMSRNMLSLPRSTQQPQFATLPNHPMLTRPRPESWSGSIGILSNSGMRREGRQEAGSRDPL